MSEAQKRDGPSVVERCLFKIKVIKSHKGNPSGEKLCEKLQMSLKKNRSDFLVSSGFVKFSYEWDSNPQQHASEAHTLTTTSNCGPYCENEIFNK